MKNKQAYEDFQKKWSKVIAKAWFDESFKQKLLQNPEAVLKEMGISHPGVKFEVHESTEKTCHLVIPVKPSEKLSEEALKKVAAGGCQCELVCEYSAIGN